MPHRRYQNIGWHPTREDLEVIATIRVVCFTVEMAARCLWVSTWQQFDIFPDVQKILNISRKCDWLIFLLNYLAKNKCELVT
jgi:hypothetical protein